MSEKEKSDSYDELRKYLDSISDAIKALEIGGSDTDVLLRIIEIMGIAGYKFQI